MRHAAVTLCRQIQAQCKGQDFDVLWCSDMLNLAEFLGLAPASIQRLPRIAYFHENQLTYPVRFENQRDLHFAYTNFTTCLAADEVWFNSDFHRQDFCDALETYLRRMPDHEEVDAVVSIRNKSKIEYPGVDGTATPNSAEEAQRDHAIRIAWNGRWEHDKNPADFFEAMRALRVAGVPFELYLCGESFEQAPPEFATAREEFSKEVRHWGYVPDVEEYRRLLSSVDFVVSTANHEFFGIGLVEAVAAGAVPLAPNRQAYPEVIATIATHLSQEFSDFPSDRLIYGNSPQNLANALRDLAPHVRRGHLREKVTASVDPFLWSKRALQLDESLTNVAIACD